MSTNEYYQALQAIADGYGYRIEPYPDAVYIVVENPQYKEDDGSYNNLVIEVADPKLVKQMVSLAKEVANTPNEFEPQEMMNHQIRHREHAQRVVNALHILKNRETNHG